MFAFTKNQITIKNMPTNDKNSSDKKASTGGDTRGSVTSSQYSGTSVDRYIAEQELRTSMTTSEAVMMSKAGDASTERRKKKNGKKDGKDGEK